ncbi:MAG: mannonate dehydratase [Spirochaetes bacterium]|uniref:mannonate dehydratase n=1 Tax=Candidatus Ornithospirochaeta stercoripullorum TaxID=2840899 RepID=A0A9D9E2L2_9SPIO|nr:mannonate dehydratase [Candidatus Ornithospirochaeta stercoripullorum]
MPDGMVWNTWIKPGKFHVDEISNDELWSRWQYFMENIIAEAEENDVILAAHPDDPPMQRLRSNARLVNTPEGFYRLVDSVPSPCNKLELCIGTLQEMEGDFDLYANIASLCKRDAVGYVHLRNVKGKVPEYTETLIDDGDIDIPRAIRMLAENGFSGPIVPDHTPYLDCKEPWLSGMAFQIGYIRACIDSLSL